MGYRTPRQCIGLIMTKKQWIILGTFILSGIISTIVCLGIVELCVVSNGEWEWEEDDEE